jgi:hypothetical protein
MAYSIENSVPFGRGGCPIYNQRFIKRYMKMEKLKIEINVLRLLSQEGGLFLSGVRVLTRIN